jgi:replication factor C subunit 1
MEDFTNFRDANYNLNFKQDNDDKSGTYRAVLISGPPGIGKTSAAHLVGDSLGYSIVEFNASDTRSKKSLDVSCEVNSCVVRSVWSL